MLEINYIPSEKKFTVVYSGDKPNSFHFNVRDLNTNLGVFGWWSEFSENSVYIEWFAPSYVDAPYCSGFEVFGYERENQVVYNKFQFKKLDTTNYFSTPPHEQCFDSWEALFYENEIPISITSDDVVYDLGANYGVFSMWALNSKAKQIYAFEPTPENVFHLNETFKWDENVQIIDKAILDKNETILFNTNYFSVGNSIYGSDGTQIEVEAINLEDYINNNNLLLPTIIKCDIEGAEFKFIHSLSDKFFETVKYFIFEYHLFYSDSLWDVVKKFLDLGYSVKSTGPEENGMGTYLFFKD